MWWSSDFENCSLETGFSSGCRIMVREQGMQVWVTRLRGYRGIVSSAERLDAAGDQWASARVERVGLSRGCIRAARGAKSGKYRK
jgi:hypothetical protein